jgi:uncharacterized membrane protein YheB (UPF0754 family)
MEKGIFFQKYFTNERLKEKVKELIQKLKNCDQNKDLVIYSNENELKNYELINFYENEGQVEIHVNEGEVL